MDRLQPYIAKDPSGSWEDWVNAAYMDRVSLSTTGFYKTPMSDYDWQTNSGEKFNYFSYGVAVSEVQIDTLTGDHVVLRTDIVMDVGQSLNPVIDIGQIEGGFIQGYGLFVLEEVRRSPTGILYTDGPSTYKIPSFTDIPVQLNVSLLKGASNPRAVYSSKGIGEPPLFLAASVFFAIRHAIAAARLNDSFQLNSPATAEKIRMACVDQFTKQFPEAEKGSYTPWVVDP
ncbi:Xanthine dehydrogenase/oxidase [Lamellibrachia satsuma]|nr:Xanthine dehydrogenase/oxidase [Lamellibrachia satsuma]